MRTTNTNCEIDQQGIIPGVAFSKEELQKRTSVLKEFENQVKQILAEGKEFKLNPFVYKQEDRIPPEIMRECLKPATKRYDFELPWIPGFFSNIQLGLFLGGMAIEFIADNTEDKKDTNFIIFQLRKSFCKKKKYLLYTREEIISHEACHAARSALKSKTYEEMIAYHISPSRFRRYMGPIFNSSSIMKVLGITFLLFMAAQLSNIFTGLGDQLIWSGRAPFMITLLILLGKNHLNHRKFQFALNNLLPVFGENSEAVIFRLSDAEIETLALKKYSVAELEEKIIQPLTDLRKQMLRRYKNKV